MGEKLQLSYLQALESLRLRLYEKRKILITIAVRSGITCMRNEHVQGSADMLKLWNVFQFALENVKRHKQLNGHLFLVEYEKLI